MYADDLKNIKIPFPPLEVQKKIAEECGAVDMEVEKARKEIEDGKKKIEEMIMNINVEKKPLLKIANYTTERIAYSKILPETYVSTDNMLQNCEGVVQYQEIPNIDSVIEYREDDLLLSNIRPYLKKLWLSNRKGGVNPDVLVIRIEDKNQVLPQFIYHMLARDDFFDYVMSDIKGMKMPRGKKETIIRYEVPIPSLEEQKRIVAEVEKIETKISDAQRVIDEAADKKKAILEREL